jgi:TrmH family RNA methyltransferase
LCIAEGFHLLDEALKSRVDVPVILCAESVAGRVEAPDSRIVALPDALFQSIASTETSQGVMALVKPPEWTVEDLFVAPDHLIVVLDGLQDPGNAGAIVRAAEAFGATGVMYLKGTVSPWNPKSLRASAGSSFPMWT